MRIDSQDLWSFLPIGYVLTVAIELPILLLMLSRPHPVRRRIIAGFWLTACTYPIVVVVMPLVFAGAERWLYLLVAETFAPAAECALFAAAFHSESLTKAQRMRDFTAIVAANLASFGVGILIFGG